MTILATDLAHVTDGELAARCEETREEIRVLRADLSDYEEEVWRRHQQRRADATFATPPVDAEASDTRPMPAVKGDANAVQT